MEHPFRWAFIGAGTLGKQVAREITASGRHQIVSVYTRNPEKRAAFAREYGAFAAETALQAMDRADVDGVYIVTPHTSHAQYTLQALSLGKPVLCEKPVTTDAEQAEEMIRLSREKGVYFAEAMWTWFSPIANKVKEWLDHGAYGDILQARMTYRMMSLHYAPRVSDPNVGGGALLDVGIYPLTYFYRLFGYPEKIVCRGTLKNGIDTKETVHLHYPGGKIFTASISIVDCWGLEKMKLLGTKGETVLPFYHYANQVTLRKKEGGTEKFQSDGGMLNEFDRVAEEIRQGRKESAYVPHEATLNVMKMMDECRRQMGLVYPFEREAGRAAE